MLIQGLESNTNYEFAVRLHVDQLSSPWSPVVYHTTLPEGETWKSRFVPLPYSGFPTRQLGSLGQLSRKQDSHEPVPFSACSLTMPMTELSVVVGCMLKDTKRPNTLCPNSKLQGVWL